MLTPDWLLVSRRLAIATLFVAFGWLCGPVQSVAAICPVGKPIDYLAPVRGLPQSHPLPADGHLSFAPRHLTVAGPKPLLLTGDAVEVTLASDAAKASYRPGWTVTLTVRRVNSNGRSRQLIGEETRRLGGRRSYAWDPVHLRVLDLNRPGLYRADVQIDTGSRPPARFHQYLRVVRPTVDVELHLDRDAYLKGETVAARVENHGTTGVESGSGLELDGWNGTRWTPVGGKPTWFMGPASDLLAGTVGKCEQLPLPADLKPGNYRVSKPVGVGGRRLIVHAFISTS